MLKVRVADAIDFLKSIPTKSVSAVVTSPPYNIGVDYDTYSDSLPQDEYIKWSVSWIKEALRISEKGLLLNIGASVSRQNQLFQLLGAISSKFIIQNTIIWCKSIHINSTTGHFKPINSDKYVNNTHEYIFHIVDKDPVNIDRLRVGVPFKHPKNIKRFKSNKSNMRCRGSVLFLPYRTRSEKKNHPATYPQELSEYMINISGEKGTIVDPFLGSGSTLFACVKLQRDFMGCDISKKYIKRVIRKYKNQPKSLFRKG